MNDVADDTIIEYVDGRMSDEARAAFERRIANDPATGLRVKSHRWLARQIVAALEPPPIERLDETFTRRLGLGWHNDLGVAALRRLRGPSTVWPVAVTALAASLALIVLLPGSGNNGHDLLMSNSRGQLLAQGALADGLSNELSGEDGPIRIGLSFRTEDGVCRAFHITHGVDGLGCRSGEEWLIPVTAPATEPRHVTSEYRLAAGDMSAVVMAEVDRRIRGEPLSRAEESALRKDGWR